MIWSAVFDFSVLLDKDSFLVRYGYEGDKAWLFPCGSPEGIASHIRRLHEADIPGPDFYFLREEDVNLLNKIAPGEYNIIPTPENDEYLYDAAKYASLAGGSYMRIRNRVHCAEKNNNLTVVPVTDDNLSIVYDIEKWWCIEKGNLRIDADATKCLLKNWSTLGCEGVIVLVDGKPRAVTAGYPLSDTVFDFALSKADVSIKGLSDYCKNALANRLYDRYSVLNGEDDLGIEGLKHMKELMRPIGKIRMFKAIKKHV